MYLNITVATPPVGNGISHKPIKGTKYVYYEHGRRYDSKRGYPVPQTTSIGKICEEDDSVMYPNANYLKFFPEAELSEELPLSVRSGCLKIGDYLVIKRVIEYYGLDEEISGIIGKDAGLFLDLAVLSVVMLVTYFLFTRFGPQSIDTWGRWIKYGCVVFVMVSVVATLLGMAMYREMRRKIFH